MGKTSHAEPGDFASELAAYLRYLINANGGGQDLSGRWMAQASGGARSYDYWSKLIKGRQAMTTNDLDVVGEIFGMTAFEFVRNASTLTETGDAPAGNVGPHPEDYDVSTDPGEYGLAAKKKPKPREK